MSAEESSTGLFASLRRMGDSALSLVQRRLELLSLEIKEEKWRVLDLLVRVAVIVVLCILSLITASGLLVYLLWEISPVWALGGLTLLYGGLALGISATLRRELRERPDPFSDTLAELKRDREWLRDENSKK